MGTPENILIKAGLFLADDLAVSPADRLTRLLRPLDPMADELLPILVQMEEVLRRSWEMRLDTLDWGIEPTSGEGIDVDGYRANGSDRGVIQDKAVTVQEKPRRETELTGSTAPQGC